MNVVVEQMFGQRLSNGQDVDYNFNASNNSITSFSQYKHNYHQAAAHKPH